MALNKNERRALELARERIRLRYNACICFALDDVVDHVADKAAVSRLVDYIGDALGEAAWLEDWQQKRGLFVNNEITRLDRIAWIDWMLDQPVIDDSKAAK